MSQSDSTTDSWDPNATRLHYRDPHRPDCVQQLGLPRPDTRDRGSGGDLRRDESQIHQIWTRTRARDQRRESHLQRDGGGHPILHLPGYDHGWSSSTGPTASLGHPARPTRRNLVFQIPVYSPHPRLVRLASLQEREHSKQKRQLHSSSQAAPPVSQKPCRSPTAISSLSTSCSSRLILDRTVSAS